MNRFITSLLTISFALCPAVAATAQTPEYYGVYAKDNGRLVELPSSQPSDTFFSPADTGLLKESATVRLPDGKVSFVAYRRDLATSAPDSIFISIVAKVARSKDLDQYGHVTSESTPDNLWKIRDLGYKFRVAPYPGNHEMVLIRPAEDHFVFPSGRYTFTLFGLSYEFAVDGPSDALHCVERVFRPAIPMGDVSYEQCPVAFVIGQPPLNIGSAGYKPDFSSMQFFLGKWSCRVTKTTTPRVGMGSTSVSTSTISKDGRWMEAVGVAPPFETYRTQTVTSYSFITYDPSMKQWFEVQNDDQGNHVVASSFGWTGNTIDWKVAATFGGAKLAQLTLTKVSATETTDVLKSDAGNVWETCVKSQAQ